MSVRIIVDSTSDLCPKVKERVKIVPLTVHFGEEEFIDGVTITHEEFYKKLVEGDVLPRTSQANPATFLEVFEEVVEAGDTAVVITVASKLSGTFQSAMIAASEYPEQIYVVDSHSVAIASGILAEYALGLVDEGKSAKEIFDILLTERDNVCLYAALDTLEYLQKGGRISKTAAIAGGVLNIKPVISVKDGEILTLGKARGTRGANKMLVSEVQKTNGVDFSKPLIFGFTGLSDELLQKFMEDSKEMWSEAGELRTTSIGSVVGTHAGPGAYAIAFFAK